MVRRNSNIAKLHAGYLFPEINRRRRKLLEQDPDARIISLGVGNTTEPLTGHISEGLVGSAKGLGTVGGYSGYGDEQGLTELRSKIGERVYGGSVDAGEVFISDGAKCDIGRLQVMFGSGVTVAVQDPAYPVYVDGSVIVGATGGYNEGRALFDGIEYMSCTPENDFFPDLQNTRRTDLIYFCSPNNPTGAVASKKQLKELVDFAADNRSIIIFDAAYSEFISDSKLPKTIFDVKGSREVALEVNSFSKMVGFTGVRLGWTVVPDELKFDDGSGVNRDWDRVTCTIFNGASNIAQQGGLASLDDEGLAEMRETIAYYMENARIIKDALDEMGVTTYGGVNAPYIWAHFPGRNSWDVFEEILNKCHVVTTPGSGFGPAGEGFIRFSAFGHRQDIQEAVERLKAKLR
ncbi:MAG: LL-diaminopimelate aminotransferase [Candidatus Altiarchaeales archaeon]|nr:LL-diaminopimelate aminotransferase [Candidatus Altiarchaeales archaeon]MBD3416126.1 LL-diaminopimelate aminotransferase [Candidatus Altiarchaeales archaeon]